MDKIQIVYFVEDRAQERFIKALVEKTAWAECIPSNRLQHDVRSARGGSRVVAEFKAFAAGWGQSNQPLPHLLVVAIDGNCRGYLERVNELLTRVEEANPLRDRMVFAVPDPHIERWYLLDQGAFRLGVGGPAPELPAYKCGRDYYKGLLAKALRDSGTPFLVGGAEFGEKIVEHMDFALMEERNASFATFLKDLRRLLRPLR